MPPLGRAPVEYYDISPEVTEGSAVFPGDAPYRRTVSMSFAGGDHLALSSISGTVHIGAHADAPSHYHPGGASIEARPLSLYIGPCQVASARPGPGGRIGAGSLPRIEAERVLFKTGTFPDPESWTEGFASLSPELIFALADAGVVLVGIDTPSIDPHDSKELESHQALFARDMAVLEGLVLTGVPDGVYDLVAPPLRLKGADASPVRAVLLKR